MPSALPLFVLAATAAVASAQEPSATLSGSVSGTVYTSPTGAFTMEIPVLPALGGQVRDTENVVTFRDNYGLQISVGAFAQDATLRWELSTRGTKDYLVYFFGSYVLPDFKRFCADTRVESAAYAPDLLDGVLFSYILMPGGSMFDNHPTFGTPAAPAVAKRGNVIFVKNAYTFVISTELSERVTEGSSYGKSEAEQDQILRARLVDVIKKMQFAKAVPPK